jgi:hypothetical protein
MATSYNKGTLVGVIHTQAIQHAGGVVELQVKTAKYVKDVGERYTEPMAIYVRPYSRGPKKGSGMDVGAFTEGRPVLVEYELVPNKQGKAIPAANPSAVHLCYPTIQEKDTSQNSGHPSQNNSEGEDSGDIPF